MDQDRARWVAELNDRLRCRHDGGRVMISRGISARGAGWVAYCMAKVAAFDRFTPDNDPWGEHDCAAMDVLGERVIFKIDTFADGTLTMGAEDPLSPGAVRVMTVMLAEEY